MRDVFPGRLQHLRCYTRHGNLDMLNAYQYPSGATKTRPNPLKDRETFWEQLDRATKSILYRNVLLIGGDMKFRT